MRHPLLACSLIVTGLLASLPALADGPSSAAKACASSPTNANADQATAENSASPPPQAGACTRGWLNAQAQREQASQQRQTLSGPAMSATYKKYLNTFEKKTSTKADDMSQF